MEFCSDEIMSKVFASLLVAFVENDTDNVELSFDYKKFKVKFKVELLDFQPLSD